MTFLQLTAQSEHISFHYLETLLRTNVINAWLVASTFEVRYLFKSVVGFDEPPAMGEERRAGIRS